MEFLIIYAVFALSVGVISNLSLVQVALNNIKKQGVENMVTEHPYLLHMSTFCIHVLIAPLMTLLLISSSHVERMREALTNVLAQD